MAGHVRYTALLDACVFYPIVVADSLLSLAEGALFAAKWTTRIEEEWIAALERDRQDLKGKLHFRRDQMRQAVPDWEVPELAWSALLPCLRLPDQNDHHVLAAAIAGHADCIVTANLRDFPREQLEPHGIDVIDPDTFIINQWDLDQLAAVAAFKRMRSRRKKPENSPEEFAKAFDRCRLPQTAQRLREAAELI